MNITEEKFQKLLKIAKLDIDKNQKELKGDLESISVWIEKINKFDTTKINSQYFMSKEKNNLKNDTDLYNPLTQLQVLSNAPEHDTNYFRIFPYVEK